MRYFECCVRIKCFTPKRNGIIILFARNKNCQLNKRQLNYRRFVKRYITGDNWKGRRGFRISSNKKEFKFMDDLLIRLANKFQPLGNYFQWDFA